MGVTDQRKNRIVLFKRKDKSALLVVEVKDVLSGSERGGEKILFICHGRSRWQMNNILYILAEWGRMKCLEEDGLLNSY